jgi:predicted transcriptional regulator
LQASCYEPKANLSKDEECSITPPHYSYKRLAFAITSGKRMRNRQKDEIMRDVLYTAQGGAGITKIMFHAYLTYSQAKEYIQLLAKNGLLENDDSSGSVKQFRTTPKGLEYLAAVERMSDMLAITTRRANAGASLL